MDHAKPPKPRGREAHEGYHCKVGSFWDTELKPILDDFGYLVGSEFTRKFCIYCDGEQEVKHNPDGSLSCVKCGTVYNQGKPYPEVESNPKKSKMKGMHRFFKAIA